MLAELNDAFAGRRQFHIVAVTLESALSPVSVTDVPHSPRLRRFDLRAHTLVTRSDEAGPARLGCHAVRSRNSRAAGTPVWAFSRVRKLSNALEGRVESRLVLCCQASWATAQAWSISPSAR